MNKTIATPYPDNPTLITALRGEADMMNQMTFSNSSFKVGGLID